MRRTSLAALGATIGMLCHACAEDEVSDTGTPDSGFAIDSGRADTGASDTGTIDAGDAGTADSGPVDTGSVDTGAPDAGSDDGGLPSWRQGLPKWGWIEIPGSSLSNQQVTDPLNGGLVAPTQRIDAWNGLAANRDGGKVYLACAGGHADWAGNEVYTIDLLEDQPRWHILRDPSDGASIVTNQPYYADGRPSSTHLYYALHFVRRRGRIFKMSAGSVWGDGNGNNNNVDAFDLTANDWDPAGAWPASAPGGGAIDRPFAQDPTTDDSYTYSVGAFRVWSATTGAWTMLAPRPNYANDDIVSRSPSAVDPIRRQVLFTRNAYRVAEVQGLLLAFDGTLSDVTFTGAAATLAISGQSGMEYLPTDDAFLLKTADRGTIVRIDPMTFEANELGTTGTYPPNAVNGVYTRWLYLPRLGGFAYLPSGAANFWFIATQ